MFDAFPFDEWSEDIAEFWTFGGEGSTGTWIMTALGFSVMLIALVAFVMLEQKKLRDQTERLRASGALERPVAVVTTTTTTIITSD